MVQQVVAGGILLYLCTFPLPSSSSVLPLPAVQAMEANVSGVYTAPFVVDYVKRLV